MGVTGGDGRPEVRDELVDGVGTLLAVLLAAKEFPERLPSSTPQNVGLSLSHSPDDEGVVKEESEPHPRGRRRWSP